MSDPIITLAGARGDVGVVSVRIRADYPSALVYRRPLPFAQRIEHDAFWSKFSTDPRPRRHSLGYCPAHKVVDCQPCLDDVYASRASRRGIK